MPAEAAPWQEIIAPAVPPAPLWPLLAWGLAGLVLLALLLWLFRRWWRLPRRAAWRRLGKIRRDIMAGTIPPRAGLHAAAACIEGLGVAEGRGRLLEQRFARQVPEPATVDDLLRRLQQGLEP